MRKRRTSQEKKRLSYQFDRRDNYGESQSSSVSSVRWRKRWVNQTYRQRIKQVLNLPLDRQDTDQVEDQIERHPAVLLEKSTPCPAGSVAAS